MRKYIAAGIIIGAIWGIAESVYDEYRKRRNAEVWNQANVPDTVESVGSGDASTDPGNGATADSGI